KSGSALFELKGKTVASVAFSPDGTQIVTGGSVQDRRARPDQGTGEAAGWGARTGAALVEPKGVQGGASSVAVSPDGTRIVTGGSRVEGKDLKGVATVWDAKTGTALAEMKGNPGSVLSVAFSPDGTRFFTVPVWGGPTKAWDASTGKEVPGAAIPDR